MMFLLGALLGLAVGIFVEGYVLLGRVQLLLTYGEQLLGAANRLLAAVPSRSAPRTMAGVDDGPRAWFPRLRLLTELRERLAGRDVDEDLNASPAVQVPGPRPEPVSLADPDELELDRWADDGGPGDVEPDEPVMPTPLGPATVPMAQAWDADAARAHLEDLDRQAALAQPYLDDVDRQLARFTYADGRRR